MEAVLNLFLEFLSEEQRSSSNTIAAYTNDLNQFLSFIREGSEPVARWDEVTQGLLRAFVSRLQAKDYASSTVARKVAALRSFFHFLSTEKHIAVDPTHELSSPKVIKQLPKSLSANQVAHLMAAAPEDNSPKSLRDRALLALLYATGMRVTEVVRLSTHDIDLEREQIRCDSQIDRPRSLPLNAEAVETLAAYLELSRPQLIKDAGETALFLNHRGNRLTRQGLWLIIKVCAKKAGLPADVTPHTLRHSFAAHQISRGTGLREVQRLLGHANISTTHIYTQMVEESVE